MVLIITIIIFLLRFLLMWALNELMNGWQTAPMITQGWLLFYRNALNNIVSDIIRNFRKQPII